MKNNPLFHGLVLVKKPGGLTSHDVVARARRVFQTPSVGHCGTLDPLATGLLILLVGEATKISQYILEGDKSYRVGVLFGQETDTLDITGTITQTSELRPLPALIQETGLGLKGSFQWPIPRYSAKKIDGKKLYEYAREGEAVEIPTKEMKFWDVRMIEGSLVRQVDGQVNTQRAQFELSCSKGSFIRSWVDQLGKSLLCGATMETLERTASAPFHLDQAQTLEEISEKLNRQAPCAALIPLENALSSSKRVRVKGVDAHLFKNGQISFDLRSRLIHSFDPKKDQYVFILSQESQKPMGVVGIEPGKGFTIRRVFNC
jgi:tRNA pseudouridine55 synthase